MKIETGYLYHIKDEFFNLVHDDNLMTNHENRHTRPTYLTIKENDILWFIPLSTKVEKYKKIIENKILKTGKCDTILIRNLFGEDVAILIQNAFPTLEKYVDHQHFRKGKPAKVPNNIKNEVLLSFKHLMQLKKSGHNFFYADIDRIKKIMDEELMHC